MTQDNKTFRLHVAEKIVSTNVDKGYYVLNILSHIMQVFF